MLSVTSVVVSLNHPPLSPYGSAHHISPIITYQLSHINYHISVVVRALWMTYAKDIVCTRIFIIVDNYRVNFCFLLTQLLWHTSHSNNYQNPTHHSIMHNFSNIITVMSDKRILWIITYSSLNHCFVECHTLIMFK